MAVHPPHAHRSGPLVGILKGKGVVVVGAAHISADYRIEVFRDHALIPRGLLATTPAIARAIIDQGALRLRLEDGTPIEILATAWDPGGFVDFETSSALPGYEGA